ncbi:MAG: DUF4214 domain-containing protein, partial [Candidatus Competibacterales bacterium]
GKGDALRVGVARTVPDPHADDILPLLPWRAHPDGGWVARATLTSPGADALRLRAVGGLPAAVTAAFYQPDRPEVNYVIPDPHPGETGHWSPVLRGDTVGLVLHSAEAPPLAGWAVDRVAHFALDPFGQRFSGAAFRSLDTLGSAGACNIDAACIPEADALGRATAKVSYLAFGEPSSCTGVLLADRAGSLIPYLATAHHCINTSERAATVTTFWFFERPTCGGANPQQVVQVAGGAELLVADADNDFALLQLNDTGVANLAGIAYAGWDDAPLDLGSVVTSLHHPQGDVKKWSGGLVEQFAAADGTLLGTQGGERLAVVWGDGTTELGSSGAGLFDGVGRLRGVLSGGWASCTNPAGLDFYGRLDLAFPAAARWLSQVPPVLEDIETGIVEAGQWRDYRVTVAAGQTLEVLLDDLSANADLYVRRGRLPNIVQFNGGPLANTDCASINAATQPDYCALTHEGEGLATFYIGVYGAEAAAYTLVVAGNEGAMVPDDTPPEPPEFAGGDGDGDGIPDAVEGMVDTDPEVRDNDVFNDVELFVMQQYRDFLGREADPDGAAAWIDAIVAGALSPLDLIEAFLLSEEFLGQVSTQFPGVVDLAEIYTLALYQGMLQRDPDPDGFAHWVEQFRRGTSVQSLIGVFFDSQEYRGRFL